MIRAERRKARANRSKYQGSGNTDFVPGSGGGRYGGFSSDSYYAGGGASGPYGVSGASTHDQEYEEYDAGDDEDTQGPSHTAATSTKMAEPPVADLFSFDDEPAAPPSKPTAPEAVAPLDDFDDFQAAPPAPSQTVSAPSQTVSAQNDPMFDFLDIKPNAPAATPKPVTAAAPPNAAPAPAAVPVKPVTPTAPSKPSASLFDDLWVESRGKSSAPEGSGKKTMAQLAQDQTSSRVWASSAPKPKAGASNDLFDLL